MKLNHPETQVIVIYPVITSASVQLQHILHVLILHKGLLQVRNEAAEDFLQLLKEWEKLYKRYTETTLGRTRSVRSKDEGVKKRDHSEEEAEVPGDELEVSSLVDICYGDPNETGKRGLKFKVINRFIYLEGEISTASVIHTLSTRDLLVVNLTMGYTHVVSYTVNK